MTQKPFPNFTDTTFLESHIDSILAFYKPNVKARNGFHQCFKDNGDVYDANTRHLVSSTRFIFNYSTAYRLYKKPQHKAWAEHGLNHLLEQHKQPNNNFAWELKGDEISDGCAMAYGHAFVMLCAASCVRAGISTATTLVSDTWEFMERYFWDSDHNAYTDERDSTLKHLSPYRGQNANMHTCEALIAAWQATSDERYLERAALLAERFCFELSTQTNGLIWEHYDTAWDVDLEYNIDKPDDLFKPWGFQPGHQVEWAKLLLQLNESQPTSTRCPDRLAKAESLFLEAMKLGWDDKHNGLVYGFAPNGKFADTHKYFWVHAEAIATAWRLFKATGNSDYVEHYNKLWEYSWTVLIDHEYGAWFRIRNRDGSAFDDLKSPPGKTDYHTLGAVWDVLSQQQ